MRIPTPKNLVCPECGSKNLMLRSAPMPRDPNLLEKILYFIKTVPGIEHQSRRCYICKDCGHTMCLYVM